ncbi:hypothetical protein NDU88_012417 [Pleurodeles waltl]|uniref:DUF4590 domain-containing protein n=1 Tax=Pleurodeles waltl TaxID=8319 RepID=A0AAV7R638_PLEWA|nr:hypothetical protein NDU88_012417 [Pleurodeles waltl]
MQYLGTGGPGKNELVAPKDELRMFQQICGGENLCVYRGYLCPGEHFQFLSKRHHKFPFSASLYINGIISARISTCCEYKYHVGFQQGKHGCFRVSGLSGGKPCFRCIKVHNQKNYRRKYEKEDRETLLINCLSNDSIAKDKDLPSKSQVPGSEKETQLPMLKSHQALHDGEGRSEDLHNSQRQELRYADKMSPNGLDSEKKTNQLNENRLHGDGSQVSTANIRKRLKKKRVPREDSDSEQENRSSKKDRHFRRSAHRTKARNVSVEWSFQEKLVTAPHCREGSHSDVELSDSSDTSDIRGIEMMLSSEEVRLGRSLVEPDLKLKDKDKEDHTEEKAADKGSTLQTQIADLLAVLRECDEVDQLVLRNTGMTDDLLELLTKALIESQSDIETINLNLNNLSSAAAQDIVLLLKAKPSLKRLLLFGNEMGDDGITELMSGLSDLLTKDKDKAKLQISPATEDNPPKSLNLIELDIGGNKLTSKGLWSVASFVRMNPPIQYLGLAQNNIESLEGWMEFFDSMKINTNITHMLLDENNLGDEGTRLLADMLKVNQSLTKIDLDSNNIGEDGAAAIIESLTTNTQSFLVQVSLDENRLCADTRDKINELLTQNF